MILIELGLIGGVEGFGRDEGGSERGDGSEVSGGLPVA